jgi:rRNA maturation endonuclease Nob1
MLTATILVVAATTFFALFVRAKDIPRPDPVSPTQHLEERKAAIYENLRDLQFEYRVGKLSDADYQSTKLALQKELAVVLAEIDKFEQAAPAKSKQAAAQQVKTAPAAKPVAPVYECASCGAKFTHAMKFCGECGKAMA